jgi:hypothetical protein
MLAPPNCFFPPTDIQETSEALIAVQVQTSTEKQFLFVNGSKKIL